MNAIRKRVTFRLICRANDFSEQRRRTSRGQVEPGIYNTKMNRLIETPDETGNREKELKFIFSALFFSIK